MWFEIGYWKDISNFSEDHESWFEREVEEREIVYS
jgi:hypothetical protein